MPKKGYYKNLLGQKFGRLMPIEFGGFRERSNGRNRTIWICKCDCGKTINVESPIKSIILEFTPLCKGWQEQ